MKNCLGQFHELVTRAPQTSTSMWNTTIRTSTVLGTGASSVNVWTLRKEDERRLLVAEMAWLRRIRGRSRRERIRNEKTREELGAEETVIEKIKRRLTWFGHMERMEGKRPPNVALNGHVRGDLEERGIQLSKAYGKTKNREVWRMY